MEGGHVFSHQKGGGKKGDLIQAKREKGMRRI